MRVFSVHFLWFILFSLATFYAGLATLLVLGTKTSIFLSFNLFSTVVLDLKVSFLLDYISLSFITTVLLISSIIIVYSYNYISPYCKPAYFLWVTVLFVSSMLLVITLPNLFFAMLGWDGLGLVSFFLIVYYQNQSSITSGIFTLLINRLGDSFFLASLLLIFYFYPDFTFFSRDLSSPLLIFMLVLTFITKSALYPFSPWLPLAIAAPTPISALVHSSTLVTAGLYLMIRFSYVLYSSPEVIKALLIVRIFTSFYAGFNTVFEVDFKKLIALSTLSHLGFIGLAFSLGLLHLRFFHLLVHALFKSLLFIAIGDIIINLNHSQDSRYLSSGFIYTPFSCFVMSISLVNLLGLPRVRGFFSKDLVLEAATYSNFSTFLEVVLYCNVVFTYYYTYKLFYLTFSTNKLNSYQMFHTVPFTHLYLICLLSLSTLFFSSFFISRIFSFVLLFSMPSLIKFLPLLLNTAMFVYLLVFLTLPTWKRALPTSFFSSILFLTNLAISASSNTYYSVLFTSVKSTELGLINYGLNSQLISPVSSLRASLISSLVKLQRSVLFGFLFGSFIIILSFALLLNNIIILYMTVTHNISLEFSIMRIWGQLNFQEGIRVTIELLNYFHDYMIVILILIMTFVTYIFSYVSFSPYIDKYTVDSHVLETVWTVVPIFILLFMAFPSLYLLYLMEEVNKPSLTVKVVGHQWYWEYQYSNSWFNHAFDSYMVHEIAGRPIYHSLDVDNRLVLPTLANILFLVTSADVLHSWTVPTLGIKVDAVPGRLNYLTSKTIYSGVYYGQCREICGSNHSFIPIVLEFVPIRIYLSYIRTL